MGIDFSQRLRYNYAYWGCIASTGMYFKNCKPTLMIVDKQDQNLNARSNFSGQLAYAYAPQNAYVN